MNYNIIFECSELETVTKIYLFSVRVAEINQPSNCHESSLSKRAIDHTSQKIWHQHSNGLYLKNFLCACKCLNFECFVFKVISKCRLSVEFPCKPLFAKSDISNRDSLYHRRTIGWTIASWTTTFARQHGNVPSVGESRTQNKKTLLIKQVG